MKTAIQIVLAAIILVIGYLLFDGINKPVSFDKEQRYRYDVAINRLKQIRTAQVAYKAEFGNYTGSFDTLIDFVKTGKINVIRMELDPTDTIDFTRVIAKDTIQVSIKDSLFKNVIVDSLCYIPFSNQKIEMAAAQLETGSKLVIPVFEAKIPNDILLAGLDRQLVVNLNYEREQTVKYAGLKVGSIDEANNNAGNWE